MTEDSERHSPRRANRLRDTENAVEERVERATERAVERAGDVFDRALPHVPESVRPHLRGWLHLGAVPLALVLGALALALAPAGAVRWSVAVYVATTVLLFGVSATYHRRQWGPRTAGVLKRIDHANIYLFIAGSYTPFAVALLSGTTQKALLWIVWTVAVLGVVFRVVWVGAPRWLYVSTYIALGWVAVAFLPALWTSGGVLIVLLIAAGGVLYTFGAVVYALKRPDPSPTWFGFHEVFHAFTIAAYLVQYVAVLLAVEQAPGQ
ncbi:MAG: hemolysin III family protein [Actinomycetes bacterium]